jgi:hypothetical protein
VPRAQLSGLILPVAGLAYFVDLFLRWGPSGSGSATFSGWDVQLVLASGEAVVVLLLVQFVRWVGVWRTASSALLTVFLAAFAAILCVSGLLHLHWGGFYRLKFADYGYGAWLGLVLAIALAVGAFLGLEEHGWRLKQQGERVGPAA